MKLSEKLRQRRHDDITMLHHSNIGMELIRDAEQLEAENEALKRYVETYHDEDFVMWCREQDTLLTGESDGQTNVTV